MKIETQCSRILRPWREKVAAGQVRGYNKVILNLIQDLTTVIKAVRFRIKYGMTSLCNPNGFTLIEILVVVLIIGILGAIALPQYQRAVLKSRFAALMPIAKSMADSNEAYYLEHGEYADNAEDLPIQGRMNYQDGTELEFGTTTSHAYVLATRDNDFPNRYIVYQKHSEQFPGEIHCEADVNNALAQDVCKSFGATEDIGETLTSGYLTYVLFGTGNGVAPEGDNGGDEPEEPTCPDNSVCDEDGNVTGCASGYRLRNEVCETIPPCPTGSTCNEEGDVTGCATGYHSEGNACVETPPCPENAVCNEQGQVTGCSEGYIVNGTACEVDPMPAKLQAVANTQCPEGGTRYVCTIKNGAVYRCDTNSGTINAQGECVSNGTSEGDYEIVYNPDGTEKQRYSCGGVDSGHCYSGYVYDFAAGTGKYRKCADKAALSKEATCANGYEQTGYDSTFDSHGNDADNNICVAVNAQGVCTAYNRMTHYDNTYDGNTQTRVMSECASISGNTCVNNNYKNTYAYKNNGTSKTYVGCYNSSGSGQKIPVSGTCPSGYSIKQQTNQNGKNTYKTCTSYNSIDWANATCS